MTNKITLELKESHVEVMTKKNNIASEKNISYDALSEVFTKTGNVDSPLLPGEFGLQKYAIRENKEYYMFLEKPKVVTCKYETGRTYEPDPDDYDDNDEYESDLERYERSGREGLTTSKFVAPIMLLMVSLTKRNNGSYSVNESCLHALKSPIYTGLEPVYRAPFPNIYDDGRICWGDNEVLIPAIKAIQGVPSLFLSSPFNRDLDGDRFQSFKRTYLEGNANLTLHFQMEVDKMLEDKEKTPDDVLEFVNSKLISHGNNVNTTFERFIRNF